METGRKEKEKLREQEDKERRERRAREANEAWARIRKALGARPEPAPTSPDDWNTLLASLLPDNTDSAAAAAAAVARNTDILDSLTQILAAMLLGITRVRRERLRSLLVDDGGAAERMEAAEPGWFTDIETGPLARLDAWPATPAATAKEGGGGRGAEEAAGALFRARTAADLGASAAAPAVSRPGSFSSSSSAAAPAISYPGSSSCSAAPTISHDTRTRKKQSLGR